MEVEKRETQSQPQSQSWQMLPVVLQTQDVWLHSWESLQEARLPAS